MQLFEVFLHTHTHTCCRSMKNHIQELSQQINQLAHAQENGGPNNQTMMDQLQETMQSEAEQLYKNAEGQVSVGVFS